MGRLPTPSFPFQMFQGTRGTNQLTWDVEPHLPTHRDQPPQPFGLRHVIKAAITVYRPHPPIYYTFWCFLRQDGGIDRIRSVKQSHGCSEKDQIRPCQTTTKSDCLLIKISGITRNITHAPLFTDYNFRILRLVFFGHTHIQP